MKYAAYTVLKSATFRMKMSPLAVFLHISKNDATEMSRWINLNEKLAQLIYSILSIISEYGIKNEHEITEIINTKI